MLLSNIFTRGFHNCRVMEFRETRYLRSSEEHLFAILQKTHTQQCIPSSKARASFPASTLLRTFESFFKSPNFRFLHPSHAINDEHFVRLTIFIWVFIPASRICRITRGVGTIRNPFPPYHTTPKGVALNLQILSHRGASPSPTLCNTHPAGVLHWACCPHV